FFDDPDVRISTRTPGAQYQRDLVAHAFLLWITRFGPGASAIKPAGKIIGRVAASLGMRQAGAFLLQSPPVLRPSRGFPDERTHSPNSIQPWRRLRLQDLAKGAGCDSRRQRRPEP